MNMRTTVGTLLLESLMAVRLLTLRADTWAELANPAPSDCQGAHTQHNFVLLHSSTTQD